MELEKIRETFQADRFAAEMGAEILEAEPGRARCALTLVPGHRNAAGGVMGGVIFTLPADGDRLSHQPNHLPESGQRGAALRLGCLC